MRCALLLSVLFCAPLAAQSPLSADAPVTATPNGAVIGTLKRGAVLRTGATTGGWTAVMIEGWTVSASISTRRDTLDRVVGKSGPAQIRLGDGPSQPVIAELVTGTALKRLSERKGWTQVRRSGWVRAAALKRPAPAAAPRAGSVQPGRSASPGRGGAPGAVHAGDRDADSTDATMQRATRATTLRSAPGGDERASVRAGATMETLSREGGWARVRIEGWVPERDLMVADAAADVTLSAADLRADPAANKGKIVRWEVQAISVQHADPLRRSMNPDEPYLLARGPGDEGAILYIALPKSLEDQVRALPQLTTILITARVRDGRSAPIGAPLLDLISFSKIP